MVKCCIPMCQNGLQAKNIAWKFQIWVRIQTALKERTRPLWMRTNTPSLGSDIIYVTDIRDHGESKIKLVRQREESQKIMEDKQARRRYARGNPSNPYQLTHFRISYYQPPDIAEVLAYTIIVEKWIMTHLETLDIIHFIAINEKRICMVPHDLTQIIHWLNPILDPVYFGEKVIIKTAYKITRCTPRNKASSSL